MLVGNPIGETTFHFVFVPYKNGRKEGGRSKRVESLFNKQFIEYIFVEKYVKIFVLFNIKENNSFSDG